MTFLCTAVTLSYHKTGIIGICLKDACKWFEVCRVLGYDSKALMANAGYGQIWSSA